MSDRNDYGQQNATGVPQRNTGAPQGSAVSNGYSNVNQNGFEQPFAQQPTPTYGAPQGYAPYPPMPPKKKHGWVVAVVILAIVAIIAFSCYSCTAGVEKLVGSKGAVSTSKANTVAVIGIDSTIKYDNSACSPEGLKSLLDEAENDNNIKAVVLRVDSGGGTATAGEEMAGYVHDFSKPIVVSSASMNASAAYEISSQADYIYADQTSAVGAIGTDLTITDISGLLEKLGVNIDNVTSSSSKDSSYGTRALTESERAYYQEMVNQINAVFIKNVATGRGMSEDSVRALATGMPFTGNQAVANGLVDAIGNREDAVAKAAELAGCGNSYNVSTLDMPSTDLSTLLGLLSSSSSSSNTTSTDKLIEALRELGSNDSAAK